MADSWRLAEEAATDIGACLEPSTVGAEPRGVFAILRYWYWHASMQAPNLCQKDMEKFRGYFQNFYQREEPHTPGLPLAAHIKTAKVKY